MAFWLVTGTVKTLQRHIEYYCGMFLYTGTYLPVLNRNPQHRKMCTSFGIPFKQVFSLQEEIRACSEVK
jgi:hypothetical protein